ncbi:MAG TPA: hypothetical protein VIJ93_10485, partial [bacterium]
KLFLGFGHWSSFALLRHFRRKHKIEFGGQFEHIPTISSIHSRVLFEGFRKTKEARNDGTDLIQ